MKCDKVVCVCLKDVMRQRWYATKLCVKMVCDKVACERWYVRKMVGDNFVC